MNSGSEINRRRILIYYVLVIVLPSAILGILALRGIKNDQALVERERQLDLTLTGAEVFAQLEKSMHRIEFSVAEAGIRLPVDGLLFDHPGLEKLTRENGIISGVFIIGNDHSLSLLHTGVLYLDDGAIDDTVEGSLLSSPDLMAGWQYEFIDLSYQQAFDYYSGLLNAPRDPRIRSELYIAMARVKLKQGDYAGALTVYDTILKNYGSEYLHKIPLGLVALHEMSKINLHQKDTLAALEHNLLLIESLYDARWSLERSYFLDYLSKTGEILKLARVKQGMSSAILIARSDSLMNVIRGLQEHSEYLISFAEGREQIINNVPLDQTGTIRRVLQLGNHNYFCSFIPGHGQETRGIIYNLPVTFEHLKEIVVDLEQRSRGFEWNLSGWNELFFAESGQKEVSVPAVQIATPPNLGDWDIRLYPKPDGFFQMIVSSGGGMYFPIFLVVMIILALGLVFTLRTMQSEIQLSNMKSTFVSTVSHEFKSPLTSIRHLAEMLVNDRVPSAKRKREYYEVILQQSERLGHLVENILDFSKMEAGRKNFKFEEVELITLVKMITAAFQENVIARGFEFQISQPEGSIRVLGDEDALEQVFFNLLDNACKYSGESKNIELKIESGERNARIMVRDSGVGIPEKEHEKIFRRFYRVDDERNQSVKGAGIGLSIVKRIVEEHHGKITVKSSSGTGTTILVEIPLMQ